MTRNGIRWLMRATSTVPLMALASCVDEKIVYRDGPNFVAPPPAAASFLGYTVQSEKKTVCGSCHVSQQGKWTTTAHAGAFATLNNSGAMQGLCQSCHTVSNLGNAVTDTAAGWRSTHDDRYKDVQCESCHGPGLQHVSSPTRGQMLPSIHADTGTAVTNGCAECHSGTHHPFVEEWRTTRHATSFTRAYNGTTATAPEVPGGPRAACQGCHIGQQVLNNWGVNTNYVEKTLGQTIATGEGITCTVCHDPHGSAFRAQLRFAVDSRDPENNLCVKCHNRRGNPDFTGNRDSPHAPHGPLVFGTAGWWPPGVAFDSTQSSHASERNPKLCAGCHVQNYAVTDKATGRFSVQVVGHRFLPVPCVDANGAPTATQPAVGTACSTGTRSYKSCAVAGCHSSEGAARTVLETARADIRLLYTNVDNMVAMAPAAEKLPAAAGKITTARGAAFNSALAKAVGSEAHNPLLVKALLRASVYQLNKDYNIPLPPGFRLHAGDGIILQKH
jgi:predicted CXXCH cytochrome family protein